MQPDSALATLADPAVLVFLDEPDRSAVLRKLLDASGVSRAPDHPAPPTDETPKAEGRYIGVARQAAAVGRFTGAHTASLGDFVGLAEAPRPPPVPLDDGAVKVLRDALRGFEAAKALRDHFERTAYEGPWTVDAAVKPLKVPDAMRGAAPGLAPGVSPPPPTLSFNDYKSDGKLRDIIDQAFQPHIPDAQSRAAKLVREHYEAAEAKVRSAWKSVAA